MSSEIHQWLTLFSVGSLALRANYRRSENIDIFVDEATWHHADGLPLCRLSFAAHFVAESASSYYRKDVLLRGDIVCTVDNCLSSKIVAVHSVVRAGNGRHRLFVRDSIPWRFVAVPISSKSNELVACCPECGCHDDREQVVALTFSSTVFLLDFVMFRNAETVGGESPLSYGFVIAMNGIMDSSLFGVCTVFQIMIFALYPLLRSEAMI